MNNAPKRLIFEDVGILIQEIQELPSPVVELGRVTFDSDLAEKPLHITLTAIIDGERNYFNFYTVAEALHFLSGVRVGLKTAK